MRNSEGTERLSLAHQAERLTLSGVPTADEMAESLGITPDQARNAMDAGFAKLEPDFGPGEELDAYRRQRAGKPIPEDYEQHLARTPANTIAQFEQMAGQHDEQDKLVRAEIARYPEGYGWHKGPGGGLPFDWSDSELPRLRPRDWTQVRHVRFYRVTSPRRPRIRGHVRLPRARGHARRPAARRAAGVRAGQDPGDPEPGEPPPAAPRLTLAPCLTPEQRGAAA